VGFPIPIILALLINEVRGKFFKRSVQTVVYLPHFISAVVVVSILSALLSPSSGLINQLITAFGGTPSPSTSRRSMFFLTSGKAPATVPLCTWRH